MDKEIPFLDENLLTHSGGATLWKHLLRGVEFTEGHPGEQCVWPRPLDDYEQAMTIMEENSDRWHLAKDRIAIVGFSAGGHLAACAATIAKHKPAAAVLIYPAILKEIVDMCKPDFPYPHEYVDAETCPCFLAAARDDRVVSVKNSLMMELALVEKNVPFESHIYSYGGHGFSTAEGWLLTSSVSERVPRWVEDSIGWLKEITGKLTSIGMTEPNRAICMNGDAAPVLSISCSLSHMRKQNEAAQALLRPVYDGMRAVAAARGFSFDGLMTAVGTGTIRELMETLQIPEGIINELDRELHKIINQR